MKIQLCASLLVLSSAMAAHAEAETMINIDQEKIEEIIVTAYPVMVKNSATPVERPPAADGADFLRAIPGVSVGRFGGHSLEPYIRGMSQTQLTVLHDGALQMGSGPNRMDTPSTYATIDLIDRVIVHRGFQSVLNGPGAVGGTILYERVIPTYSDVLWTNAKVGTAYESNGNVERIFGRASAGKGSLAIEGWYSLHSADNYTDGAGKEVRSAFKDRAAGVALTLMDQTGSYLQATYGWNKMEDALFPGAGMDSLLSGGDTLTIKGLLATDGKIIQEVRLTASYADTNHVMNNFSHRVTTAMLAESRTTSKSYNAELEMDIQICGELSTVAANYRNINNDGSRFGGMMPDMLSQTTTILWPDITAEQYGLAFEQKRAVLNDVDLTIGLRSDWTKVTFARQGEVPEMGMMPMSANMLYQMYYGIMASDQSEHLLSGLIKVEWHLNDGTTLYAGLNHAGRTADSTERGMANVMMMGGINSSWIGNPSLAPEKHSQFEFGFLKSTSVWSLGFSAFYDHIDDYILRDSARGQSGIFVTAPMADVYRNINAELMGFEAQVSWQISDAFSFHGDAAYTRGKDLDRSAPLAQIPPLQGSIALNYVRDAFKLNTAMRYAMKQTRVDMNAMMGTGRDPRETPSYAVFDVIAHYKLGEFIRLQAGVQNLLDKQYADHLSRSNLLDATEIQVNEPGRSFYAKLVANF